MSDPITENTYGINIPEGSYSASEVQHMVARAVVKIQLDDLRARLDAQSINLGKQMSDMASSIEQMIKMMGEHKTTNDKNIQQLERDILSTVGKRWDDVGKAFLSKEEHNTYKADVELKINGIKGELEKIWLKVSIPVATILVVLEIVFKFLR